MKKRKNQRVRERWRRKGEEEKEMEVGGDANGGCRRATEALEAPLRSLRLRLHPQKEE